MSGGQGIEGENRGAGRQERVGLSKGSSIDSHFLKQRPFCSLWEKQRLDNERCELAPPFVTWLRVKVACLIFRSLSCVCVCV